MLGLRTGLAIRYPMFERVDYRLSLELKSSISEDVARSASGNRHDNVLKKLSLDCVDFWVTLSV